MKNSDFIQMKQCNIFSIKFPVEDIKYAIEQNKRIEVDSYMTVELVRNPMTGNYVEELEGGIFFTLRTTFKKVTRELLAAKIYELKQSAETETPSGKRLVPNSEKEWREIAESHLCVDVPYSSESVNVFYYYDKELLFTNGSSKHNRLALHHLIKSFELTGFRSIVISDEKLGLNTKLTHYLEQNQPLFKYLSFQNEATLRKLTDDNEEFLTCRHLETDAGKEKALGALNNDFKVQSMMMRYEDEHFAVNFKLDSRLKIRSMKFNEYADISRQLNANNFASKQLVFLEYLDAQFNALIKIARCTVLEFTGETKLEQFV